MRKKTLKKPVTIDDLAIMVARGFENTATKDHLNSSIDGLKKELKADIQKVNDRLDDIDHRLGGIEHNHTRRIENLEDKIRIITTIFEKNLKIKMPK